jgi:phage terminase small subunit
MALLLLGWAGCAAFDRGQALVPTRYQVRTGPFIVFSNSPMSEDPPAVRCLQALERDVARELGLRPAADENPVEIYVLENRQDFDHFLKFYYPELPPRRAFFLAKGTQRVVYTYASPRLEEDLRHEATHALLRGAFGDLPLWLDEGLAEYFETDLGRPDAVRPRLEAIATDLKGRWSPNLERLESLTDIGQMTQRDYREAWSWVHLMLNGPEPGKSILMGYLTQADRAETKSRLRPRLAEARIEEDRLVKHLRALQAGPVVAAPVRETRAVRLQDQPTEPVRPAPLHGLLRRLGAWLGGRLAPGRAQ